MRLTRARLSIRSFMVAVAVMAAALELDSWRQRRAYCRDNAARCDSAERYHLWMAESHRAMSLRYRRLAAEDDAGYLFHNEQAVLYTRAAIDERARARRSAERGEGFRRAGMYPWLSVPAPEAGPIGSVPAERDESPEASPPRGELAAPLGGQRSRVGS